MPKQFQNYCIWVNPNYLPGVLQPLPVLFESTTILNSLSR